MNTVLAKINKQNNLVKIFLALFVFAFLFFFLFGANTHIAEAASQAEKDTCTGSWLTSPLICLSISLFKVLSAFVSLAVSLFAWAVDPAKLTAVIASDSLYVGWKNVRDFLNIAFILFLLFSAFCTIFQIQKYSYKSTLLNLVLMALLVNFSFPIARFIIDVSNSLAYTMISLLFPNGLDNFSGAMAGISEVSKLIYPGNSALVPLVFADIFLFIFAVTFFVMSLLFIIRIVALAILIVFSPIAFTGTIIPGIQDKASKWWEQLFSYSFFAPIMIFMLYIATTLSSSMSNQLGESMKSIAAKNFDDTSWLVSACKFVIPIIILWIGMGVGKSMSGDAGGAVVGFAQGKMKGWGETLAKSPWKGLKKGVAATGITGGIQQAWNKKVTQPMDKSRQNREAWIAGKLGDKTAGERNMKARAAQYEKDNESTSDLTAWAAKGDAAAAYALANKGKLDAATFSKAMNLIKDEKVKESLAGKTEETRMDVTLQYKFDKNNAKSAADPTKKAWSNIADVASHEYGNLKAEDWAKQKDLTEQFKNPAIETAAKAAFKDLHKTAQVEAHKRMTGANSKAVS